MQLTPRLEGKLLEGWGWGCKNAGMDTRAVIYMSTSIELY